MIMHIECKVPADISVVRQVLVQPAQLEKMPPCSAACPSGADVRGWIALVAQRAKLGLSKEQAIDQAWTMVAATNPLPATLGRICPHPCEAGCNRNGADGAVAINSLERFLGDWGLRRRLKLPYGDRSKMVESIGVIGAGPAGLSFAYQMARRGYTVTVYEKQERPGGMLQFGIPRYRLPEAVLQAEIDRILDLGVELRLNTEAGRDISAEELRTRHAALFVGIGAGAGLKLNIPGEDGPGAWRGIEFLANLNRGVSIELGENVVVVGGGNTAIDAARAARRKGARVTVLYRRTRNEMPAIESEIDDAYDEGVDFTYLATPYEIFRKNEKLRALGVRRLELGKPDRSGRKSVVSVSGSEYEIPATAVIAAVSQAPDWRGLAKLRGENASDRHAEGHLDQNVWSGGDALVAGIAAMAIGQGRRAAECVHAQLSNLMPPVSLPRAVANGAKPDYYVVRARSISPYRPVRARLTQADLEVRETMNEAVFLDEIPRCFSCGACFGCEQCFMFCNGRAFAKLKAPRAGRYFSLTLNNCESCGKCIELCPCGYLSPVTPIWTSKDASSDYAMHRFPTAKWGR